MTGVRWKSLLWVAAAMLVVAAGVRWWMAPRPIAEAPALSRADGPAPQAAVPAPPPAGNSPFLQIEGTRLADSDATGRRQWELHAKTLQVDNSKSAVMLSEVTGQLYQEGSPQLTFSAARAVFFVESKHVELSGRVVGRTRDGRTLKAMKVQWDARTQTLIASGDVIVTQPLRPGSGQAGMIIRADRLTADAAMKQATFTGNIRVEVTE